MLNYLWIIMIIISFICSLFDNNIAELSQAILSSGTDALNLCLKLTGVMCMWCGIMNIAQKSGLCRAVSRVLSPVLSMLFPELKDDTEALECISMNITANLFGLGNAATPLGLNAVKKMQSKNKNKDIVSRDIAVFVVLNTAALQLIPSTSAFLRESAGAEKPMDIIICVWISSALSLFVALLAVKFTWRFVKY